MQLKISKTLEEIIARSAFKATREGLTHSYKDFLALELLLDKFSPNDKAVGLKYAEKSFYRTEILKLHIQSISGKAKHVQ